MKKTALLLVSKSLSEPIPVNFDTCTSGYRIIVEYSGKDYEISVTKAEILDKDWELMPEESKLFMEQVTQIVQIRNLEYRELINQTIETRKDRTF